MERICPAFGVCPVPLVKKGAQVTPNTAPDFLRPMKWMYDRPAEQVHDYAHKYRSDVTIKASEAVISNEAIVPTLKIDYYTLNFREATDSKSSEEIIKRAGAWTVGNYFTIIPPCIQTVS